MPTGYTCAVQDGKITEFRDFAKSCARAFGANILMRDDPMDAPIEEYKPASYRLEWLQNSKDRLVELQRMTLDEARAEIDKANEDNAKYRRESAEKNKVTRERYETMLAKVRAWSPPTPDHVEFKKFMTEQLEESIRHDCTDMSDYYGADTRTPEQYLAEEIEDAHQEILRNEREWQEEVRRTDERNAWNRNLFDSLR